MKAISFICIFLITGLFRLACTQTQEKEENIEQINKTMTYNKLTTEEKHVILEKGTERPFTGKYENSFENGVYVCKQCNSPLYNSSDKFHSKCGWPSFDDEIKGAVKHLPDADGRRTEIICANCDGHLGHVFLDEGFTQKNTRHCVNSISLKFIPKEELEEKTNKAIFASGCFWGTEFFMKKAKGVIKTQVGYIGGNIEKPTYNQVCSNKSGHAEAIEIIFDPKQTSFKELAVLFFETHDFTQIDRQGSDIGTQYRSGIFYSTEKQKKEAEELILILTKKGYEVATEVTKATEFWEAEDYHQDYYSKTGKTPYCHIYKKIFD